MTIVTGVLGQESVLVFKDSIQSPKHMDSPKPRWHENPVPFNVFTWSMAIIMILFGFVFAQIASLNATLANLKDGQGGIKEQLIRIDERQSINIRNIEKIVNKLNVQ
jgi:hypothetical protein